MARLAAAARTLASLLLTTAIVGAAAAGLVTWAGWPLPDHWPTADQFADFAEQPLDHLPTKLVLAGAGWLLWLLLVLCLGLEAWIRIARRPPALILPRPLRVLAAGMLGTSVVALATPAHASPPAATSTTAEHPPTGHTGQNADGAAALVHNAIRGVPVDAATGTRSPDGRSDADRSPRFYAHRGVDIPGGWVVWPVAAGVLAATAITLLRSGGLAPASALVRAIRAARHPTDPDREQPATEEPASVGDDIAALEQDATTRHPLTIGLYGTTEIGIDSLPRSGVGIAGPGSMDALRAILVAAATCTDAAVVIPASLLHTLTGTHPSQPSLPGITAAKDAAEAMHSIQMEIHRRFTLDQENNTRAQAHPPLLLLIEPTLRARRLAALAELGGEHNVRIVVAGPWPEGTTWTVDRHGHTTSGTSGTVIIGRVNILNHEALTQIAHALQPTAEPAASPAEATPPASAPASPPLTPIHLCILGPPRLVTASSPALHIRRSGSRQIAVYLALHPDGANRDQLLEHVFGHLRMASAATSLNSCLYELRRLLTIDHRSALLRVDDLYRLDPQLVTVDWWQLLHHLQRGDLAQATACYTGPIADGHTWHWLPEHRQNARRLIADTHATLARTAATPDQGLTHALAGINTDPYSTTCYLAAIDAAMKMGQPDRAQAFREQMARRLTFTSKTATT
jgi:DNA-binding SARP family transcriptional activator